ncbi:hypothetical protein BaRGS_00040173, partial [Batillaria attramentaria]
MRMTVPPTQRVESSCDRVTPWPPGKWTVMRNNDGKVMGRLRRITELHVYDITKREIENGHFSYGRCHVSPADKAKVACGKFKDIREEMP